MIELWRTDIHGNEFFMRSFTDPDEAERVRQEFEERGHHQTYWIRRADLADSRGRLRGTVRHYDDDRGVGSIRGADGGDYTVRFGEINVDGFRTLASGLEVIFRPAGREATDVRAWEPAT